MGKAIIINGCLELQMFDMYPMLNNRYMKKSLNVFAAYFVVHWGNISTDDNDYFKCSTRGEIFIGSKHLANKMAYIFSRLQFHRTRMIYYMKRQLQHHFLFSFVCNFQNVIWILPVFKACLCKFTSMALKLNSYVFFEFKYVFMWIILRN